MHTAVVRWQMGSTSAWIAQFIEHLSSNTETLSLIPNVYSHIFFKPFLFLLNDISHDYFGVILQQFLLIK